MPVANRTAELPLGSVSMEIRGFRRAEEGEAGASTDTPAATFELVFTTGAAVRRYDWVNGRYYLEQLQVTPEAIDLARLERGAPLLNSHWAYTLEDQIGVVDQPEIAGGVGTVQSQLSRRDSVRGIVQDLADRVIRNVSVGYQRHAVEMVAPSEEAGMWVYNVTRWTPLEVSLVAIPADIDSQVRSADGRLPDGRQIRTYPCLMNEAEPATQQRAAAVPAAAPPTPAVGDQAVVRSNPPGATMPANTGGNAVTDSPEVIAARAAGAQAERTRQTEIRAAANAARSTLGADADALAVRLIDAGTDVDGARREVLEALATRSAATATRGAADLRTTADEVETARAHMEDAIVLRVRPGATTFGERTIDAAGARRFRGMSLIDLARRSVTLAGGNPDGLTRREVALASLNLDSDARRSAGMLSTSDFPNVLANTVSRSLRAAYQLAPRTFAPWTRRSTAPDFREKAVVQLSELTKMQKVNEGGEYKMLKFGESAEKYSLSKYGGIIAITWEALVNDDMGAFDRLPLMIAEEASGLEGDIVYGILSANANMGDGKALFVADHGNLAGSNGAINVTTLGAARAAMRKQKGAQGRALNLTPDFLIVGPDKEQEANQYTSVNYVATKGVDINPAYNTALTVIVDNRIEGNTWYLSSTPSRVDTIEYAYLEGEEGLFTERKEGFEVDGVLIKARHVFAAKAIDFRGLYKNPGA